MSLSLPKRHALVRTALLTVGLLAGCLGGGVAQGAQPAEKVLAAVMLHRVTWMPGSARFDMCSLSHLLGPRRDPSRLWPDELLPRLQPCGASSHAPPSLVRFRSLIFRDSLVFVETVVETRGERHYETYRLTLGKNGAKSWQVQSVLVDRWATARGPLVQETDVQDFPMCFVLVFSPPRPIGLGDIHGDTLRLTQRPFHTATSAWKRASISGLGGPPHRAAAWREVLRDSISVLPPEEFPWRLEGRLTERGLEGALVWPSDDVAVPPQRPSTNEFRGRRVRCEQDS